MDDSTDIEPKVAELDAIADWVAVYRKAKDAEKLAKEKAEEARAIIAATLDETEAEFGTVDDEPVIRWRSISATRLDTKKLREQYPDLADEFSVTKPSMRMEIL